MISSSLDCLLTGLPNLEALRGCGHVGLSIIGAPNWAVLARFGEPRSAFYHIALMAKGLVVPSADSALRGLIIALLVARVPNPAAASANALRVDV